jgi:hypothetical protein
MTRRLSGVSHVLDVIRSTALAKGATSGSRKSLGGASLCSLTRSSAISATLVHSFPTGETASQKVAACPSIMIGCSKGSARTAG